MEKFSNKHLYGLLWVKIIEVLMSQIENKGREERKKQGKCRGRALYFRFKSPYLTLNRK